MPKAVPVFATNVTAVDRPEDVAFGPSLMPEVVLMDMVDRLRKVLMSLTFDGPLFTGTGIVFA